jgi:hypothetical protein
VRSFLFLGVLISLSGCGDQEFFIANKVKFKVSFEEESVQVSFDLQKDYQIRAEKIVPYENLGTTYITWDQEQLLNNVGSKLLASQNNLANAWPTEILKNLPNGADFPPAVGGATLHSWTKSDEKMQWDLAYQSMPKLLTGGSILSGQFDSLPKNFLATQNFKLRNGTVVASISLLGRTKKSKGGVFFIGNFGINPYEESSDSDKVKGMADVKPAEWEVAATEPAMILTRGTFWSLPYLLDFKNWILNLEEEIQNFAG